MTSRSIGVSARIPRPCSIPGCPELTHKRLCDAHRQARQREQDEQRLGAPQRVYDAEHRRLRVLCFQRDGWRRIDCGWMPDVVRDFHIHGLGDPPTEVILAELRGRHNRYQRHLHADHKIRIAERPDLRLTLDNLATLCSSCHASKSMKEMRQDEAEWRSLSPVLSTTFRAPWTSLTIAIFQLFAIPVIIHGN